MQNFTPIAIVLALVGIALVWFGIRRHRRHGALYARATGSWARTRATVVAARIAEQESTDSDGDTTTWYKPELHYRYAVGGQALEGRRTALCSALSFARLDPAQTWLLTHAPGSEIDLWYDPAEPAQSAPLLDKPSLASAVVIVIVGIGFVFVGGIMAAMTA